jgi:hypothetical protein
MHWTEDHIQNDEHLDASHAKKVVNDPYLYEIAEGNIPLHRAWCKLGYNGSVTGATAEIISPQGGAYVFPTAAITMRVRSDSAQDKVTTGTGVWSLTIYYLDADYNEQSVGVTMSDTGGVNTTASNIFRIQNVRTETVGTGYAAAGNISITDTGAAVTYGYIAAGNNRQRQMVWTVPKGNYVICR